MDAWPEKKNSILEGLLTSTQKLVDVSRAGDLAQMEACIQDRNFLLHELEKCDEALSERETSFDFDWFVKLGHINRLDEEVQNLIGIQMRAASKELSLEEKSKTEIFKTGLIEQRGTRVEVKA